MEEAYDGLTSGSIKIITEGASILVTRAISCINECHKISFGYFERQKNCLEDVNGNGRIGPIDLLELRSCYGSDNSAGYLNGDGQVNIFDILLLR